MVRTLTLIRWVKGHACGLLLSLAVFLTGCAHYHLGFPVHRASFKTIYVAPAVNKAYAAQVQSVLTRQVREELLRNGDLAVVDRNQAEAILEMTITKYGRSIGAVYETDPDTAKTLSLNLTVMCHLKSAVDGHDYFKNRNIQHSLSITANDYAQAIEYQKLPQLTREVAKKIALLIANTDA